MPNLPISQTIRNLDVQIRSNLRSPVADYSDR